MRIRCRYTPDFSWESNLYREGRQFIVQQAHPAPGAKADVYGYVLDQLAKATDQGSLDS